MEATLCNATRGGGPAWHAAADCREARENTEVHGLTAAKLFLVFTAKNIVVHKRLQ